MSTSVSKHRDPPDLAICVDEKPIADLHSFVREVTVTMSRAASTTLEIVLDETRSDSGCGWRVLDQAVFLPWSKIRVEAKFGSCKEEVFRGYIKQIRADYPRELSSVQVVVEGQDQLLLLDRVHVREVHRPSEDAAKTGEGQGIKDGALARRFADEARLQVTEQSVADGLMLPSLHQDETAATFLRARAEANGFELFVRDEVLHFHRPRFDWKAPAPIIVHGGQGSSCVDFQLQHDGHKPDRVRLTCAALSGIEPIDECFSADIERLGEQATSDEEFTWCLRRPKGATLAELRSRAQAAANANAWKIVGEGELDGSLYGHVLFAHQVVEVQGIGRIYSGQFYVDEVTHRFSSSGYRQRFRLLRNATN
jgi:hypothetical protein